MSLFYPLYSTLFIFTLLPCCLLSFHCFFLGEWSPLWALVLGSDFSFLNQSLTWPLPPLLLPLLSPPPLPSLPPPVTVTFPSHPMVCRPLCLGERASPLLQSCSRVPCNHRLPLLQALVTTAFKNTSLRAGVGRARDRLDLILVSNSGQRFGGEEAGPTGYKEVGNIPFLICLFKACPSLTPQLLHTMSPLGPAATQVQT